MIANFIASKPAQRNIIKLYVFAGQSNMEDRRPSSELTAPYQYIMSGMNNVRLMYLTSFGNSNRQFITPDYSTDDQQFGPYASFLWHLSNDNPGTIIYALNIAWDASRLWIRPDRRTWNVSGSDLYNVLFDNGASGYIERAKAAIIAANPGYTVNVEVVIWKQGEGDILDGRTDYYTNFIAMSNAARAIHGNFKWILGRHNLSTLYDENDWSNWLIDLNNITSYSSQNSYAQEPLLYGPDLIHLTSDGMVIMGENYYNAYLAML